MIENKLSETMIGCAIKIHKALGPGLLEAAYLECLHYELTRTLPKVSQSHISAVQTKRRVADHPLGVGQLMLGLPFNHNLPARRHSRPL